MAEGFRVRRVYDDPAFDDGVRVLVDRLWPRGLSKDRAHIDRWPKELTPSTELRRWYHEAPADRHGEFVGRYRAELDADGLAEPLRDLREAAAKGTVTLLTAVKDIEASHVPVLLDRLAEGDA
ncbi:DUF488 domain-containing protein [Phytomonospora endophytica]|uniref:Uncharacterized protein YeaO (DUF488 family) n=1 Tax=Phytomonospora endophytica TaxID=714109 RepID=A0A841FJ33_9ACTN|nr:DUF488 family protein [Phytomonospora endophytica]MBB6035884.1 uncharacterized protein YeaO (DUF488 family) [Phytomonospora endophytica]GIG71120.1 hypothetical protein Pen01_74150 [Phytomonospora endophytica]